MTAVITTFSLSFDIHKNLYNYFNVAVLDSSCTCLDDKTAEQDMTAIAALR
jgi:hypothetical protein